MSKLPDDELRRVPAAPVVAPAAAPERPTGDTSLPATLMVLTVVTGLVDAVSFLGLGHVFTANMTGNVVFLAFAVAGAPGLSIPRSLASLIAFLAGAVIGGRLGVALGDRRRRWLLTVALVEAALLFAAAFASVGYDIESTAPASRLYAVIILTALAMGLRNATVRRLAVPDMTTTVLTLTLTGIAADSSLAGGANPRVGRRVASVLLMFAGAAVGALLLRYGLALPLVLSGACVLVATIVYAGRRPPAASPRDAS
ncbi:MAG TPA: YoaK family protein [Pyrinomonadaceae bacterium]|nr:YoaK family protein [Pyrinomonadaceae bacterium]